MNQKCRHLNRKKTFLEWEKGKHTFKDNTINNIGSLPFVRRARARTHTHCMRYYLSPHFIGEGNCYLLKGTKLVSFAVWIHTQMALTPETLILNPT